MGIPPRFSQIFPQTPRVLHNPAHIPRTTRTNHQPPSTMPINFYDDWSNQCQKATQDLRVIRKLLERLNEAVPSDAIGEALDCQERVRKILFFAEKMAPPPSTEDDEPDGEDDADETLADVLEGLALEDAPVGAQDAPVTGEYKPWAELKVANWVEGAQRRMYSQVTPDDIKYLTERGKIFPHPNYEEAFEWAKSKGISPEEYNGETEACPIPNCQGRLKGYSVKGYVHQSGCVNGSALLSHLRDAHSRLMFLSQEDCPELDADKGRLEKCGCDGNGVPHFHRDGFSNFKTYLHHLKFSVLHNPAEGEEIRRITNLQKSRFHRRQSTN